MQCRCNAPRQRRGRAEARGRRPSACEALSRQVQFFWPGRGLNISKSSFYLGFVMANAVLFRRLVSSLRRRGAKKVSLFGSYARGEQRKGSDIDVVVDFSKPKSLLELVRIEGDVSAELGVKVDLLTSGSVSSHLSNAVKRDVKVLLG